MNGYPIINECEGFLGTNNLLSIVYYNSFSLSHKHRMNNIYFNISDYLNTTKCSAAYLHFGFCTKISISPKQN